MLLSALSATALNAKVGKAVKIGAAIVATGVVAGVTAGCIHGMSRPTLSVFCQSFEPIEMPQGFDYEDTRIAIAGHNAVYRQLCTERSFWEKTKQAITGKDSLLED